MGPRPAPGRPAAAAVVTVTFWWYYGYRVEGAV
jgi:hypothetical protein